MKSAKQRAEAVERVRRWRLANPEKYKMQLEKHGKKAMAMALEERKVRYQKYGKKAIAERVTTVDDNYIISIIKRNKPKGYIPAIAEINSWRDTLLLKRALKKAGFSSCYSILTKKPIRKCDAKVAGRRLKVPTFKNSYKYCSECKETKPIDAFGFRTNGRWRRSYCHECESKRAIALFKKRHPSKPKKQLSEEEILKRDAAIPRKTLLAAIEKRNKRYCSSCNTQYPISEFYTVYSVAHKQRMPTGFCKTCCAKRAKLKREEVRKEKELSNKKLSKIVGDTKWCTACKTYHAFDAFRVNKDGTELRSKCKAAEKVYFNLYNAKNKAVNLAKYGTATSPRYKKRRTTPRAIRQQWLEIVREDALSRGNFFCGHCHNEKPKDEFPKGARTIKKYGIAGVCYACENIIKRERYRSQPAYAEIAKQRMIKYHNENSDTYNAHKEEQRLKGREDRLNNTERAEKNRFYARRQRAELSDGYIRQLIRASLSFQIGYDKEFYPPEMIEIIRYAVAMKRLSKLIKDPNEKKQLCITCGEEKPLSGFSTNDKMALGVQSECVVCNSVRSYSLKNGLDFKEQLAITQANPLNLTKDLIMRARSAHVYDKALNVATMIIKGGITIRQARVHAENLAIAPRMAAVDLAYSAARGEKPDVEFLYKPVSKARKAIFVGKAKELATEVLAMPV